MPTSRDTLTGSRIREKRIVAGLKQSELARRANISPSYLNLIEHNRRRIGGKLLIDLAQALQVEPVTLTEGAETALLANLREAATDGDLPESELSRIEEFAGRFPGWARLLADNRRRVESLQRSVEALTDRLTHDPHLAASLHEMLSTVTAIRSAASILAEPGQIEPEWQRRFNRNIYEDSARLADSSRTLAQYLEKADSDATETNAPQDEVDAVLLRAGFHLPALEGPGASVDAAMEELGAGLSQSARWLLQRALVRYADDARAMPLGQCAEAIAQTGSDPLALALRLDVDVARAMRRLAHLPDDMLDAPVGLAICDGSGVTTYRKPLPEFPLPRLGAGCALWPLYRALTRPMMVLFELVQQSSRTGARHRAIAVSQPVQPARLGQDALFESHMLIVPERGADTQEAVRPVGLTCRICPHPGCEARREPSILIASNTHRF
ncbi:helix-turn-helix transcriptional regulator [Marivita sp. GX14005]|uniref:helix-turn-helix domain-containing protein n=1 Tax=Marivita sp. GX14005 TaxID=2942276 RepID=UPI002019424B|nr:helix-turn-helix transcriptional regulator [Marivita sp. GX14005]MCL3880802.1 helix-turn-helix domain-containing protein [Marivita sp. GX14005]